MNIKHLLNRGLRWGQRNLPDILTGAGIAGFISSTFLAVRATPKALRAIEAEKEEGGHQELTTAQTIKTCWKYYIPAAVTGMTGAGCLIYARHINNARGAALATAYSLSETALAEYRQKLGAERDREIQREINEDHIRQNPPPINENALPNQDGSLFYDSLSGRYFHSSRNRIDAAVNEVNRRLLSTCDNYISLNEFYDELGLAQCDIGNKLGWDVGFGIVDISYDFQTIDNISCTVIAYNVAPRYLHF